MRALIAFAGAVFLGAVSLHAADNNAAYIKARQGQMSALGGHMEALGSLLKGKINKPDLLKAQAEALHSGSMHVTELFPQGSTDKKSHSKASIWKDWKTFEANAADLEKATAELAATAQKSTDAAKIGPAMGKVGEACKSCHKSFKEVEKDAK